MYLKHSLVFRIHVTVSILKHFGSSMMFTFFVRNGKRKITNLDGEFYLEFLILSSSNLCARHLFSRSFSPVFLVVLIIGCKVSFCLKNQLYPYLYQQILNYFRGVKCCPVSIHRPVAVKIKPLFALELLGFI